MALQPAEDRRHREGSEGDAAARVVGVHRLDDTDGGDLLEVLERLRRGAVSRGERPRERQMTFDQLLAGTSLAAGKRSEQVRHVVGFTRIPKPAGSPR